MSVMAGTIIAWNVVFSANGGFIVGTIVAGTTVVFPVARVGTAVTFEVIAVAFTTVPFTNVAFEAVAFAAVGFAAVVFGAVVGAGVVVILNVGIVTGSTPVPLSEIMFVSWRPDWGGSRVLKFFLGNFFQYFPVRD